MGLRFGMVVAFLGEVLTFAMQVFALQAGYSYASSIDPNSERQWRASHLCPTVREPLVLQPRRPRLNRPGLARSLGSVAVGGGAVDPAWGRPSRGWVHPCSSSFAAGVCPWRGCCSWLRSRLASSADYSRTAVAVAVVPGKRCSAPLSPSRCWRRCGGHLPAGPSPPVLWSWKGCLDADVGPFPAHRETHPPTAPQGADRGAVRFEQGFRLGRSIRRGRGSDGWSGRSLVAGRTRRNTSDAGLGLYHSIGPVSGDRLAAGTAGASIPASAALVDPVLPEIPGAVSITHSFRNARLTQTSQTESGRSTVTAARSEARKPQRSCCGVSVAVYFPFRSLVTSTLAVVDLNRPLPDRPAVIPSMRSAALLGWGAIIFSAHANTLGLE